MSPPLIPDHYEIRSFIDILNQLSGAQTYDGDSETDTIL